MNKRNIEHILTKEPGDVSIKECVLIRDLLLKPDNDLVDRAELLLFLADRAQHVEKLIRPSLKQGLHVICDRFSDSTRIYQQSRGLSREKIDTLIGFATSGLVPDITFVLDIPINVGLKRAKDKSKYENGDRMEMAGKKFHEDVRHGFLKLAESITEQARIKIIDATPPRTIEEIHNEIVGSVSKKLWLPGERND